MAVPHEVSAVLSGERLALFGFIAAEADLYRLRELVPREREGAWSSPERLGWWPAAEHASGMRA